MEGQRIEPIRSDALEEVPHGFLGRQGGVSSGLYAGLNVGFGSDDDQRAIAENRRRAVVAVKPGATLVTVHQVHGANAVVALPDEKGARPHADALVTDRSDMLLGILTADCVPVLLADARAGIVGAAHAGWKGALGGVIPSVVEAMVALGADRSRIAAAIGPCIAQPSYEVDGTFRDRFIADDRGHARFFSPGLDGRHQFDIEGFVARRLDLAGVGRVDTLNIDTYADERQFFSYRRATHRGERDYGRQIALIGIGPPSVA
jgi:hypothetical protein